MVFNRGETLVKDINFSSKGESIEDITSLKEKFRYLSDSLSFFIPKKDFNNKLSVLNYDDSPLGIGYIKPDGRATLLVFKTNNKENLFIKVTQKECAVNILEKCDLPIEKIEETIKELYSINSIGARLALSWICLLVENKGIEIKGNEIKDTINIFNAKPTEEDIIEMISLVDIKRFEKLISIASFNSSLKRMFPKEIINKYLRIWAESKFSTYKIFNRSLLVKREIDLELDETLVEDFVSEIKSKFPKYVFLLSSIEPECWVKNEITEECFYDNKENFAYFPAIKQGMKLSKALAIITEDKDFEKAYNAIFQNRKIKTTAFISIDPYDFLTSSINKNNWSSCHGIDDGDYATGAVAYMLDQSTVMSYVSNGVEQLYNIFGYQFKGNSKSWRMNIVIDGCTGSFAFSKSYPNESDIMKEEIKNLILDTVSERFVERGFDTKFNYTPIVSRSYSSSETIFEKFLDLVKEEGSFHYNDFFNSWNSSYLYYPSFLTDAPEFKIGSKELYCPLCLKSLDSDSNSSDLMHYECFDKASNSEETEEEKEGD
jgi:hypothetical protein